MTNFSFDYSATVPTWGEGFVDATDKDDAHYHALNFVRDKHDGVTNIDISDITEIV